MSAQEKIRDITQEEIDLAVAEAQEILKLMDVLPVDIKKMIHARVHGLNAVACQLQRESTDRQQTAYAQFALIENELLVAFILGMKFQKEQMMQ